MVMVGDPGVVRLSAKMSLPRGVFRTSRLASLLRSTIGMDCDERFQHMRAASSYCRGKSGGIWTGSHASWLRMDHKNHKMKETKVEALAECSRNNRPSPAM